MLAFSLLCLGFEAAGQFTTYTARLSPKDIFWPDGWFPSVAMLSSNHAGEIVDLTLNCHINEEVPKGSYIEMKIRGFEDRTYNIITDVTFPLEGDNILVFPDIQLPETPGSYGPVSVLVRHKSEYGQILAASTALTYFAIIGKKPEKSENLTVSYAKDASRVILETTTLTFSFMITADLFINDYFVLSVDPLYTFDNINEGPIWDSSNPDYKYFENVKMKFDAESGQLYFYGLNVAVSPGVFFKVSVANVVNPPYVVTSGFWEMQIYRFGVPTLKQDIYAKSDLQTSIAGKFSNVAWDIDKKYLDKNPIFENTASYMVLNFTLSHAIPLNGYIIIKFSKAVSISTYSYVTNTTYQTIQEVDEDHPAYIYFEPYKQLNCKIDSNTQVTCTVTAGLSSGDKVSIYNLVYLSGENPGVLSIVSYSKEGYLIDTLSSSLYLSYESNENYIYVDSDPYIFIAESEEYSSLFQVGTSGSAGILISFQTKGIINPLKESLSVGIAFTSSSNKYFSALYFKSLLNCYYSNTNGTLSGPYTRSFSYDSSSNKIVIIFPDDVIVSEYDWINIFIESSAEIMSMPLLPSGQAIRYEVSLMYRSEKFYYFYRKPLYFSKTSIETSLELFCNSSPQINLPVQLSITPSFDWIFDKSYKVYISFFIVNPDWTSSSWFINGGFNSLYPSTTNNAQLLDCSSTVTNSICLQFQLSDTDLLVSSESKSFIVPFPAGNASSTISVSAKVYAKILSSGIFQLIGESSTESVSYASSLADASTLDLNLSSDIGSQNSNYILSWDSTISYYSFGFTQGFSLDQIADSFVVFDQLDIYSNSLAFYSNSSAGTSSVKIFNIVNTWLIEGPTVYITVTDSEFTNTECAAYIEVPLELNNGEIEISTGISPNSTTGLGATTFSQNFTIAFKVPGFFKGSASSFLLLSLYSEITEFSYTLQYSSYSLSGSGTNEASIPITKDIKKDGILTLNLTISLFKVTSPGETIDLITNFELEYEGNPIYSSSENVEVYFESGKTYTSSDDMAVVIYPNVLEASNVYFFMSFTSEYDIPENTLISISGYEFDDDENAKNDVWCTLGSSKAYVEKGVLKFYTLFPYESKTDNSGNLIQIIKDLAFTNPSANDEGIQFKVTAEYNGFVIISDEKQSNRRFKFNEVPTDEVYMESLSLEINNMGIQSWHTFTFKVSVDTTDATVYVFDVPEGYTAHAGVVYSYNELPNLYFLNSYSSISKISCTVEHWIIVCAGMKPVKAKTVIDISLLLINSNIPEVKWSYYISEIIDDILVLKSNPLSSWTTNFSNISEYKIDILSVTYSTNQDQSVNLTMLTNISYSFSSGDYVEVEFPRPYEVNIYNPTQILCSKSCSGSTNEVKEYCIVEGNSILLSFREDFGCDSSKFVFRFYYLINPVGKGFTRDEKDKIVTDYTKYDYWSDKFVMYIKESENTHSSSSASNLNSAYTGFLAGSSVLISINDGNSIQLTAGTFSDLIEIKIENNILQANILKFLATDYNNNKLGFDFDGVYFITNDYPQTYFRVGISSESVDNFYYITWSLQETPIVDNIFQYNTPSKTEVQVSSVIKKNIITQSKLTMNTNSLGVLKIDFNRLCPFSDMHVKLSLEDKCKDSLTIWDSDLIAHNYTTELYAILESLNIEITCTITYSISGSSSSAFNKPNSTTVEVKLTETDEKFVSADLSINGIAATLGIQSNFDAMVYWAFMSSKLFNEDSKYSELEYIKNNSVTFYGDDGLGKSLGYQILNMEIRIAAGENPDWGVFSVNTIKTADTTEFYGNTYVPKSDSGSSVIYKLFNLVSSIDYTLVVYAESMSRNMYSGNASATAADYDKSIVISIKLDELVDIDNIITAVALGISVSKDRVIEYATQNRRLINSYDLLLLPSMRSAVKTKDIARRLTQKSFLSSYNFLYPSNNLSDVTLYIADDGIDESDYGKPEFSSFNWNYDSDEVSANFSVTEKSNVCCAASKNDTEINGRSIKLGYDEYGDSYIWQNCTLLDTNRIRNLTFTTTNYSTFYIKCIPCNLYPIIPFCNQDSLQNTSSENRVIKSYSALPSALTVLLIWTLIS